MTDKRTTNQVRTNRHGGRRRGAGRPAGGGPYGEPTQPIRIPQSLIPITREWLKTYRQNHPTGSGVYNYQPTSHPISLPLFASKVPAGFPSPADDYIEDTLSLDQLLINHPAATFYLRVSGDSMRDAAIMTNDILVVDRALDPKHGDIVVASIHNELTVKRLYRHNRRIALMPENPDYQPIEINEESELLIWGVVTGVVRQL